jgi:hypothetical protein
LADAREWTRPAPCGALLSESALPLPRTTYERVSALRFELTRTAPRTG